MADRLSADRRSAAMRAVGPKNTAPDLIVRRVAHAMRLRYRLHAADLSGKPDIVFRSRRKVVFVHRCFWHGHDCRRGRRPATNTAFWNDKLAKNIDRDRRQVDALTQAGWWALVIWECETGDRAALKNKLRAFLD